MCWTILDRRGLAMTVVLQGSSRRCRHRRSLRPRRLLHHSRRRNRRSASSSVRSRRLAWCSLWRWPLSPFTGLARVGSWRLNSRSRRETSVPVVARWCRPRRRFLCLLQVRCRPSLVRRPRRLSRFLLRLRRRRRLRRWCLLWSRARSRRWLERLAQPMGRVPLGLPRLRSRVRRTSLLIRVAPRAVAGNGHEKWRCVRRSRTCTLAAVRRWIDRGDRRICLL